MNYCKNAERKTAILHLSIAFLHLGCFSILKAQGVLYTQNIKIKRRALCTRERLFYVFYFGLP